MSAAPFDLPVVAAAIFGAALVAWLVGEAAIRYAHRRALLDQPGQRRSHATPTPRGGGVGVVAAVLALALAPLAQLDPRVGAPAAVAFAAVAAIGWVDDHRPLGALPRLVVHLAAGAVAVAPIASASCDAAVCAASSVAAGALVLAWSVNLHNFMDGIDGLLGFQAVFVLGALAALGLAANDVAFAALAAVGAAAVLGFLPLNVPRARIFLGDVGSGALGLLIGWLGVLAVQRGVFDAGGVLVLSAAFVVDAGLTLLSRMLAGRRWYAAHREHLYQWLVRTGLTHMQVVGLYFAFDVFVVAPLLVLRDALHGGAGQDANLLYSWGWPTLGFALAIGLWVYGKRACLRRARYA
jgi:UDP-N-acetylmuramyl pentapeptide phosphotransferase/UDP-N-acetylglucosamine-1-phosphate transferase